MAISENRLRSLNNVLSVAVVLVAVYIIAAPFLPNLLFWWDRFLHGAPNQTQVISDEVKVIKETAGTPAEDTLLIPAIDLKAKINTGNTTAALRNKAAWLRPNSVSPDIVGNTVIVGHRFTYKEPGVFYHLDKLKVGDRITIYWQSQLYNYEVAQTIIVEPNEIGVEQPADTKVLTLYTCTPLWTSKQRLVIRAIPTQNEAS